MNNATRFTNSWFVSYDDSELRPLILNEFAPLVLSMINSPKFPGIKVTIFRDNSAIIDNKTNGLFIIASSQAEFVDAFLTIFNGDLYSINKYFTECVEIGPDNKKWKLKLMKFLMKLLKI